MRFRWCGSYLLVLRRTCWNLARNDTLHNGGGGRRDGEGRVRRRGRGRFRIHGTKVMAWVGHNTAQDHHQTL